VPARSVERLSVKDRVASRCIPFVSRVTNAKRLSSGAIARAPWIPALANGISGPSSMLTRIKGRSGAGCAACHQPTAATASPSATAGRCDCPFVGNQNGKLAPAAHRVIDLAAHHRCFRFCGRLGFGCGASSGRALPAGNTGPIACPQLQQRQPPAEGLGGTSLYLTAPFSSGRRLGVHILRTLRVCLQREERKPIPPTRQRNYRQAGYAVGAQSTSR
jgi:hypothetical protein